MIEEGCLAQSKDNNTSTCQRDSSDKNFTHPHYNDLVVSYRQPLLYYSKVKN